MPDKKLTDNEIVKVLGKLYNASITATEFQVLDVKSLSKELAKISKNCEYATLEVKNRDPKADFIQYLAEAKKSLDLLDEKLFNK